MHIILKKITYLLLGLTLLISCRKSDQITPVTDRNTLNYVVRDNFSLRFFAIALNRTGIEKQLEAEGQLTVLAPSDEAFISAGYNTQAAVAAAASKINSQIQYHILQEIHKISDQPLGFNKQIKTSTGKSVYLTRVKLGVDTITTINGARILKNDIPSSNGLIHAIDKLLFPMEFDKVGEAISAEKDLSLFYQALKYTGLLTVLNGPGQYTVFALDNASMIANGYPTLQSILAADKELLSAMLRFHIVPKQRFVHDYFFLAEEGRKDVVETMLDGRTIKVVYEEKYQVPNSFSGIKIQGPGNGQNSWDMFKPKLSDYIVAGNGIVHVLNKALKP